MHCIEVVNDTTGNHHMRTTLDSSKESRNSSSSSAPPSHHPLRWLVVALEIELALFAIILAIDPGIKYVRQQLGVPKVKLPTLSAQASGVAIFDRNDHYVCTLRNGPEHVYVPLEKISPNMRLAAIAAEDRHFYTHFGVDPAGIGRAALINYKAGHIVQGGSTITQQLARNLFLDKNKRTLKRKLTEAVLAWDIDHTYSKAKILETYLNNVYFGNGAYGVELGALRCFNKHANQLNIPESAYLAGLIRSPSLLSMPEHRDQAIQRQHEVIATMLENKLITDAQAADALSAKLKFQQSKEKVEPYPYYLDYVTQELQRKLGDDLWKHPWHVYTNLDVKAQKSAEAILTKGIKHAPHGIDQGALVTVSVNDGAVLAMVGGVNHPEQHPWNRALFRHTAGSAFKPFVYLSALIDGKIQPDSYIDDSPVSIFVDKHMPLYVPKNFDGEFKGWIPVREALALSRNVCSVKLGVLTGLNRIIEIAHAAGIKSQLEPYPSLACGYCAVSPLEMSTAYASIARGGVYVQPQFIRHIYSDDGAEDIPIKTYSSVALPNTAVLQLTDFMQDVVRYGTGTRARLNGIEVAGKTGTADNGKDIWFVGFTPDTLTAVWGGNDKNQKVSGKRVTGGVVMASIWHDFMTAFYHDHKMGPRLAFIPPPGGLQKQQDTATATATATTATTATATTEAATTALGSNQPGAVPPQSHLDLSEPKSKNINNNREKDSQKPDDDEPVADSHSLRQMQSLSMRPNKRHNQDSKPTGAKQGGAAQEEHIIQEHTYVQNEDGSLTEIKPDDAQNLISPETAY